MPCKSQFCAHRLSAPLVEKSPVAESYATPLSITPSLCRNSSTTCERETVMMEDPLGVLAFSTNDVLNRGIELVSSQKFHVEWACISKLEVGKRKNL
jgi:hypothetical protein